MESFPHVSIPIENESEIIIQTEWLIKKEFTFSFGTKLGIYTLMRPEVQLSMTLNVKRYFN